VNWVTTDTGHRCNLHAVDFARGETCGMCDTDPGELGESVRTSEVVDHEIISEATEFQKRGRRMWRECREILDTGTASEKHLAAKLSAEAAKWERLAIETRDRVAARKQLREAMAHEQAMSRARR
jgi:hypothetical protein